MWPKCEIVVHVEPQPSCCLGNHTFLYHVCSCHFWFLQKTENLWSFLLRSVIVFFFFRLSRHADQICSSPLKVKSWWRLQQLGYQLISLTNIKTFCSLLADFTFEGKGSAIVAHLLYQKTKKNHIWLGKHFKYTELTSFPPKVTGSLPAFTVTLVSVTIILTTMLISELKRRVQHKEYKKGT